MAIPIGLVHQMTARGACVKDVACEQCGCEFVYVLQRTAQAKSTSWFFLGIRGARLEAYRDARGKLDQRLLTGCDPVPCPKCGWYQAPMQAMLRKQYWSRMNYFGYALMAVSAVCVAWLVIQTYLPEGNKSRHLPEVLVAAGFLSVGVALLIAREMLAKSYDPNTIPVAERLELASSRAVLREDFEDAVREYQQARRAENERWSSFDSPDGPDNF